MVYNITMRVISGKYKGRKLVAPKNDARPTLDRAKETLFNILGNISGTTVLDLFAGSGQVALECLSRGAVRAVMCDNGRDAVAAINENFAKVGEKPELFRCEYGQCLRSLATTGTTFDIVYVDPPYHAGYYNDVLRLLCSLNLLNPDGVIVCEHPADVTFETPDDALTLFKQRKVGSVIFAFYKQVEPF